MAFRDNLRETLDFLGMEQKELSAKTGLSLKTIENYVKKDSSLPTVDKAVTIAQALGVSVEYLMTGKKNKERTAPRNTAPTQRNPGHRIKVEQNQLRSNSHSRQNPV